MLRRIEVVRIFVPAENIDRIPADAQSRSGYLARVNCIADGRIRRAGALGPHVPLGRKARHQIGFGSKGCRNCAFGYRLLHSLQIFRARMEEEVYVGIDQSWHDSDVAEINSLRVRWMRNTGPGFSDALTAHQYFSRRDHSS